MCFKIHWQHFSFGTWLGKVLSEATEVNSIKPITPSTTFSLMIKKLWKMSPTTKEDYWLVPLSFPRCLHLIYNWLSKQNVRLGLLFKIFFQHPNTCAEFSLSFDSAFKQSISLAPSGAWSSTVEWSGCEFVVSSRHFRFFSLPTHSLNFFWNRH